jgi:signal transduction histidine kinase
LARFIGDLADASQLGAGQFRIQTGRCDLIEIVREQVELAQARAEQHTIHFDGPPSLPVNCDRDRLVQVFANVLTNAIKYTPRGAIDVRVEAEGEQAVVSIRDRGPGIPAAQAETIFDLGSRLANSGTANQANGHGFGLYIAKGIVEAHGGRIWVEAAEGTGAIFRFTLPLSAVSPPVSSDVAGV